MSEIKKYKKYLNFKANPRYLTRDFIVPLYTGTEPDILDDSDTQRESSVYKEFPNDMPIISPKRIQNQPYEQLELADGGSVERRGFAPGGIANTTEFAKQQRFFKPSGFQRVLITKNSPLHKVTMKALFEAGIDFGKDIDRSRQAGFHVVDKETGVKEYRLLCHIALRSGHPKNYELA